MSELLADSTAVVTGAASGNGRGIALTLAEHGADVVVADLREQPRRGGDPTHEVIEHETASSAVFRECNVTNIDDVESAVAAADEFGGIDVMVNNAGVVGPEENLLDVDLETYRDVMSINLDGALYGSRVAGERMREQGTDGSIVNISSLAGLVGHGDIGPYSISKGGLTLLTYTLAAELGQYGIRVNAVHPGMIETALFSEDIGVSDEEADQMAAGVPLERLGTPEDVGKTVVYLASDLASYVSGESILVDGGVTNTVMRESR